MNQNQNHDGQTLGNDNETPGKLSLLSPIVLRLEKMSILTLEQSPDCLLKSDNLICCDIVFPSR